MGSKSEYQIPGLEDVGVPGKRNSVKVNEIASVMDDYKSGNGLVIRDTGTPATRGEIPHIDPQTSSTLINLPTSMDIGASVTVPGSFTTTNASSAACDSGQCVGDSTSAYQADEGAKAPSDSSGSDESDRTGSPSHPQGTDGNSAILLESAYLSANARRDALMPPLTNTKVVVVGLGGGAPIPIELAKCGVQKFSFFDFDTLDAGNLIRHPCGTEFVGLPKAQAVAEYLKRQSGGTVSATAFVSDVFETKAIETEIQSADLLIVATDNETSRFYLSELAVKYGVPAVFVGMFQGGTGGEIFAFRPGQGCYCCLAEHIGRKAFIKEYVAATHKGDCASVRDTSAMPGLGVDQGILCHLAARKSLDLLLQNKNHALPPLGKDWIIFSICGIPTVLADSLTSIQYDIPKHVSCLSCGS